MLGLILALLYVAYQVGANSVAANVAVANTFGFLWGWHLTWTIVWGIIIALIFLIGLVVTAGAKTGKGYGLLASFAIAPVLAIITAIRQTLFLGAVALMTKAGMGAEGVLPWDQWNITLVIIAGIMYLVAVVFQRNSYNFSSKKSD